MSDFTDRENSLNDSKPIECYHFFDGFEDYKYCNVNQTVIIPEAGIFEPAIIRRDEIEYDGSNMNNVLKLSISLDADFVRRNVVRFGKPRMSLRYYRLQDGVIGSEFIFDGIVAEIQFNGEIASVTAHTVSDDLSRKILTRSIFRTCYHAVYSSGSGFLSSQTIAECRAIKANFTYNGVIEGFGANQSQIISSVFQQGATPPIINRAYLGFLKNNTTNEIRTISGHPSIYMVNIIRPFVGGNIGNSITFTLGCAKNMNGCIRLNSPNDFFSGFPEMPIEDRYATTTIKRYLR
jgi:hypothetical protein